MALEGGLGIALAGGGGYLLGSIPFGLVLTRAAGLGDIRAVGSGNIGATNVLRTGNKGLALATLLLDGGKGAIAVGLALWLLSPLAAVVAGGAAFLGHCFPVWLNFKGGKGVATFLGTLLAIAFPVGAACCGTWLVVALVFRISSLAALVAAAMGPVYAVFLADWPRAGLALFCAALIFIRHRPNIERLLAGTEPKIGGKK